MSANSWFSAENDPLYNQSSDNSEFPPQALPIRLFEEGYDVWLANNRGVEHSLTHSKLDYQKNGKAYWNFSFAEIGKFDIPAMVSEIKRITEREDSKEVNLYAIVKKIQFVGYDQGATAMLYALAKQEGAFLEDIS